MYKPPWYEDELVKAMPDLMGFAKLRAPNEHVAEDLVQETFYKMLALDRDLPRKQVRPYAFGVLRNLITDYFRSPTRSIIWDEEVEDSSDLSLELQRVVKALGSMKEECQDVLSLAIFEHTQREIADVLDKPIGTIGSWLQRCRRKLGEVLGLC